MSCLDLSCGRLLHHKPAREKESARKTEVTLVCNRIMKVHPLSLLDSVGEKQVTRQPTLKGRD